MKKWFNLFSAFSLIIGVFLLFTSQTGLTGAVIGTERAGSIGSIIGVILIIGGLVGMMVEEGRLEKEIKKNSAQILLDRGGSSCKARDIIRVAKEMNYILDEEHKEGTRVYGSDNNIITVIPNHKTLSIGVYKNILKALSSGKSNFRKY